MALKSFEGERKNPFVFFFSTWRQADPISASAITAFFLSFFFLLWGSVPAPTVQSINGATLPFSPTFWPSHPNLSQFFFYCQESNAACTGFANENNPEQKSQFRCLMERRRLMRAKRLTGKRVLLYHMHTGL